MIIKIPDYLWPKSQADLDRQRFEELTALSEDDNDDWEEWDKIIDYAERMPHLFEKDED